MQITRKEEVGFDRWMRSRLYPPAWYWYQVSGYQADLDPDDLVQQTLIRFHIWAERKAVRNNLPILYGDENFRRNARGVCGVCLKCAAISAMRYAKARPQGHADTSVHEQEQGFEQLPDTGTVAEDMHFIASILRRFSTLSHPRASQFTRGIITMMSDVEDNKFTPTTLRRMSGLNQYQIDRIAEEIMAIDILQPSKAKDLDDEAV